MIVIESLREKWVEGNRPEDLAEKVLENPELLDEVINGLSSEEKRIRGGCAEIISLISEKIPERVLPYIDTILEGLDSGSPIRRWEAICTLGNLSQIERSGRISAQISRIAENLSTESVVLRLHTVRALGKIGRNNPSTSKEVFDLLIGSAKYFKEKDVGFVAEALTYLSGYPDLHPAMMEFAQSLLKSKNRTVLSKAKKLITLLDR